MQRTRWAVIAVIVLVGLVWIGQGTGLLRGSSFMVGDPFWAFAGLALQKPFPALLPEIWSKTDWFFVYSTYFFVYLSVVLCVVRGVPVIAEFVHAQKSDILGKPGRRQ